MVHHGADRRHPEAVRQAGLDQRRRRPVRDQRSVRRRAHGRHARPRHPAQQGQRARRRLRAGPPDRRFRRAHHRHLDRRLEAQRRQAWRGGAVHRRRRSDRHGHRAGLSTMATALIIGASRGIGHELVKQYLADGWRVIATARKADDGELLDVAVLNAGVYGPRHDGYPPQADFDAVMHTNVLAAMRLLPIVAPMVCAARGKLAVISSRMGSLSERDGSSGSLYRASKAALNSVLIDTAIDFGDQGAACVAFHPGWVRTDMGGADADISVEQSAGGIRATLAALPASPEAVYRNYDGATIGW